MTTWRMCLPTILSLALASVTLAGPNPLKVVKIPLPAGGLDALQQQVSLDWLEVKAGAVTALVNDGERAELRRMGVRHEVVIQDASFLVPGAVSLTGVGAYHTNETVKKELEQVAQAHADIATLTSIGKSVEGRSILALKLEKPGKADRPKLLFMGLHHAREWISVEVPLALIKKLTESKERSIRELLETRTIWVVPVVNPDGFEYSQKSYTMWRKNRHKTWILPGVNGVDPNRNYGFEWSGPGSSSMPLGETYRGPSPFSEPEVQAIRDLATREKFTASISFHSFSELILYPWGYTRKVCPDDAQFRQLGGEMATHNHYKPETGSSLYLVNGEADDWLYGSLGVRAFTIELAKSFIPRDSEIPKITAPNVEAALHLVKKADSLAHDPNVALHLMERLTGAAGAERGPWSPFTADEAWRKGTLAWAAEELAAGLSTGDARLNTSGPTEPMPQEMAAALRGTLGLLVGRGATAGAQKVQSLLNSR